MSIEHLNFDSRLESDSKYCYYLQMPDPGGISVRRRCGRYSMYCLQAVITSKEARREMKSFSKWLPFLFPVPFPKRLRNGDERVQNSTRGHGTECCIRQYCVQQFEWDKGYDISTFMFSFGAASEVRFADKNGS